MSSVFLVVFLVVTVCSSALPVHRDDIVLRVKSAYGWILVEA